VFYLIFGHDGPDPQVQRGLESAAGFLRNALSKALMIRYTPILSFELDTSIEHGVRLAQLIDSVKTPGGGGAPPDGTPHDAVSPDAARHDGTRHDAAPPDAVPPDGTPDGG
jgi:hypothetical protein